MNHSEHDASILIVDDSAIVLESVGDFFREKGYLVDIAQTGNDARQKLHDKQYDVLILDIILPDISGVDFLNEQKEYLLNTYVFIITGYANLENTLAVFRLGAVDLIIKPIDINALYKKIKTILENQYDDKTSYTIRKQINNPNQDNVIIGRSKAIKAIIEKIGIIAPIKTNILIQGESGTGKELIAQAIHMQSERQNKQPLFINCAAIPENIVESELFGHIKGAFTGAVENKKGIFELASGSTLILDEIGEMPTSIQAKLLRAIEQETISPVGSSKNISIDVRLICSTNRDLTQMIDEGRFRRDLFHRINTVTINIPPLCNRREDIPLLINHYIQYFRKKLKKHVFGISNQALRYCIQYNWPGNIRELANTIENAIIFTKKRIIDIDDLPDIIRTSHDTLEFTTLNHVIKKVKTDYVKKMISYFDGDKQKAAEMLDIHISTLYRIIEEEHQQ